MSATKPEPVSANPGFWRKQMRQWHWISSAICLVSLVLFAVTGFTLNHAADIQAKPQITRSEKELSPKTVSALAEVKDKTPLPASLVAALKTETGVDVRRVKPDVSDEEIFFDLAGPGVDSSLTIEREGGFASYERTERGTIAVLNDLHKGRHTGPVWSVFIDIIALACVVFSLTGLGLLWIHGKNRRITWPLVGVGVVLPFVLFMIFVHG